MSIGKNTVANIIGGTAPLLVTIITVPIYLRIIGEERYGTLSVIWVLLSYFTFFNFGLGKATAQRIARLGAESQDEASGILWTSIILTVVLGGVGGFVLWISADLILRHLVTMSDASRREALDAVPWLILALPTLLVTSVMIGALQAREKFILINVAAVSTTVINQLVPLAVALMGYQGLEFLVPAAFVGSVAALFLNYSMSKKYVPLDGRPRIERAHVKPLLNYGGGITLISILGPILISIDRILIALLSGAKSVAYYAVPYSIVFRLTLISAGVSAAIFPRLASHSPKEEIISLATRSTNSLVLVMTPLTIAGFFFIRPFLVLWVGYEFAARAAFVGEILFVGVWINCFAVPHYTRLQATGRLRALVLIYMFEIPIYLLMLWVGLKYWGIAGVAAAWSLRVLLDTVLILATGDVLKRTCVQSLYSMLLVSIAFVVCLMFSRSLVTYLIFLIVFSASLYMARGEISKMVKLFYSRGKAV